MPLLEHYHSFPNVFVQFFFSSQYTNTLRDDQSVRYQYNNRDRLLHHRSISLMKFLKGTAQLPTKVRPLRKSVFKRTPTEA